MFKSGMRRISTAVWLSRDMVSRSMLVSCVGLLALASVALQDSYSALRIAIVRRRELAARAAFSALAPFLWAASWAVWAWLSVASGLGRLRGARDASQQRFELPNGSISVLILSWNGRRHLERILPSVFAAIDHCPGDHEVIVVDNGSDDGTDGFLAGYPRALRVISTGRNLGFGAGMNAGIAAARKSLVFCLDNDMILDPECLAELRKPFQENARLFATSAQIFLEDPEQRREETGRTRLAFESGQWRPRHDLIDDAFQGYEPVAWGGGGSTLYHAEKLKALGGFDPIFRPFYVEDVGLGYRAWQRDWPTYLVHRARVIHAHRATIASMIGHRGIDWTIRRNTLVGTWRYSMDAALRFEHAWRFPLTVWRRRARDGVLPELIAFAHAMLRVPEIAWGRFWDRKNAVLSDREIMARSTAWSAPNQKEGWVALVLDEFEMRRLNRAIARTPASLKRVVVIVLDPHLTPRVNARCPVVAIRPAEASTSWLWSSKPLYASRVLRDRDLLARVQAAIDPECDVQWVFLDEVSWRMSRALQIERACARDVLGRRARLATLRRRTT